MKTKFILVLYFVGYFNLNASAQVIWKSFAYRYLSVLDKSPYNIPDSLNMCRIATNRIKTLEIYDYKPLKGLFLITKISYDTLGNMVTYDPHPNWFNNYKPITKKIDCHYKTFRENNLSLKDTVIREKKFGEIITRIYDHEGYLILKTNIKAGLIKYHNEFGGSQNTKTQIIYSDNHKNVNYSYYKDVWTKFKPNTLELRTEDKFDDNGNLLVTRSYDGKGNLFLEYRFIYTYW